MMKLATLCLAALVASVGALDIQAAPCQGKRVYVNGETGSDDDASSDPQRGCTLEKPLRTFAHVLERVGPGSRIVLVGGALQSVPGLGNIRAMHASCLGWRDAPSRACLALSGVHGTPLAPIAVQPHDTGHPLLVLASHDVLPNGDRPEWHKAPNTEWEPNWGPGRSGVIGEFRSTRLIPGSYAERGEFLRVIASVSPLSSDAFFGPGQPRRHVHIAHYRHLEDLRATNERAAPVLCGPGDATGPAPSPGYIRALHREGKPIAPCPESAPARWRIATYIGPGIHAQKEGAAGFRLYARLASTSNGVPGLSDYVAPGGTGFADPRQVPFLLAFSDAGQALSVGSSSHVMLGRPGGPYGMSFWGGAEAVRLVDTASDVTLRKVRAYSGVVPLRIGSRRTAVFQSEANGGLSDWLYRNDIKDGDHPAPGPGAALAVGPSARDVRIQGSAFRGSLDGVILDGDHLDFDNNLVEDIRDDALLLRPSPVTRGTVRGSRFRRFYSAVANRTRDNDTCQVSCSANCPSCPTDAPCTCAATCTKLDCISNAQNLDLAVIGNHFDLRRGAAANRPWVNAPSGLPSGSNPSVFSASAIFQDGGAEGSVFSFTFIHNTVVAHNARLCHFDRALFTPTCQREAGPLLAAFRHALGPGEHMTVLNNIFYVGTLPDMASTDGAAIVELRSDADERYESAGNIYFRSGLPARVGPLFSASTPTALRFDCQADQTYSLWTQDSLFLSSGSRFETEAAPWLCANPRIATTLTNGFFPLLAGPSPAKAAARPIPAKYRGYLRCAPAGCNVGAAQ